MQKILIYGLGDFAKLVFHYFSKDTNYKVVGFCADKKYIRSEKFCNLPLISFETIETVYSPEQYSIFIAVGYSIMRNRIIMFEKAKSKYYNCVNYISSDAIIDSSIIIGENNFILENTVIEPFVTIGDNNIIWSSSNICHNVKIDSHSFIAANSLIGGFSEIKNNCFLGFNSTVIQNITLEKETLVGANSLILKNTNSQMKYIGSKGIESPINKYEGIKI